MLAYHENDPNRLAAYVGKGSWNNIGHRLSSKFQYQPQRENGIYRWDDRRSGETFVVEAVVARTVHEVSALEEFIIDQVQSPGRVYLLNGTAVER